MIDESNDNLELQLIKNDQDEIKLFAEMSIQYIKENDKRPLQQEIDKIQSNYHIDHCWILNNQKIIGMVKIVRNIFYNLRIFENIEENQLEAIIKILVRDVKSWHVKKIEATVHSDYLISLQKCGFKIEFSRKKMTLKLDEAKNLLNHRDIPIGHYKKKYLNNLISMFADAYRGGIDEQVGMFGPNIAQSAINSIFMGRYGEFNQELSSIVIINNQVIAGLLTTIVEGCPFVVIIGVSRKYQGQQIGRKLMSNFIIQSKSHNYREVRLWVTAENKRALHLYESMGYKEIVHTYTLVKFNA